MLAATGAAGTVVIDPETDTISATGGALLVGGGNPHAAQFTGAAKGNNVVIIRIPKKPITLTRAGGTETMIANNFTLQGLRQARRRGPRRVRFPGRRDAERQRRPGRGNLCSGRSTSASNIPDATIFAS